MFFCKERKRLHRTQHSFEKNIKERKERNILLQKNAECCILLKRTHGQPSFPNNSCLDANPSVNKNRFRFLKKLFGKQAVTFALYQTSSVDFLHVLTDKIRLLRETTN